MLRIPSSGERGPRFAWHTDRHDDGSRDGTFVNGRRVKAADLRDGDVLRIGNTELTFKRGGRRLRR